MTIALSNPKAPISNSKALSVVAQMQRASNPLFSVADTWSRAPFSRRRAFLRMADAVSRDGKPVLRFSEREKLPSVGK